MGQIHGQHKPSKKSKLGTGSALFTLTLYLALLLALRGVFGEVALAIAFPATLVAIIVVPLFRAYVYPAEPPTPRGRRVEVERGTMRQFDDDALVGSIDLMQPFEYEILDRHRAHDSLFRVHQQGGALTFYNSDPGGAEAVRDALQIEWPRPARGASRSVGPSIEDGDFP